MGEMQRFGFEAEPGRTFVAPREAAQIIRQTPYYDWVAIGLDGPHEVLDTLFGDSPPPVNARAKAKVWFAVPKNRIKIHEVRTDILRLVVNSNVNIEVRPEDGWWGEEDLVFAYAEFGLEAIKGMESMTFEDRCKTLVPEHTFGSVYQGESKPANTDYPDKDSLGSALKRMWDELADDGT